MAKRKTVKIALLWSQFSTYHVDRCEAVAARLAGRAEVIGVEVASASELYAWQPSGEIAGVRKVTLFPGLSYERVSKVSRLLAQFRATWRCDMVFIGIGYNQPDVVLLAWLLRLCGARPVLMFDSKFDDYPRTLAMELFKALVLAPFCAAIAGSKRTIAYLRFLGFRRRPVLPGYDGVSLDRVRAESGAPPAPGGASHAGRPFLFVGRFVEKKNLLELAEGYAAYARQAGPEARRLVLVGSGPVEPVLRARLDQLEIADLVDFPGFLPAAEVSRQLGGALALLLVSSVEQWGLVCNEALACGLPAIVSEAVGSRDALVRNLVNGFVVEAGSTAGLAAAMSALASDPALWRRMAEASQGLAWLGDCARLADAVEHLVDPTAQPAADRIGQVTAALGPIPVRGPA